MNSWVKTWSRDRWCFAFQAEISAALAARYSRNIASAASLNRKRSNAAAASVSGSPSKSARRDADATRRKQKTAAAASASYQSKRAVDDTLYCLCKTPYDESKLVMANDSHIPCLFYRQLICFDMLQMNGSIQICAVKNQLLIDTYQLSLIHYL